MRPTKPIRGHATARSSWICGSPPRHAHAAIALEGGRGSCAGGGARGMEGRRDACTPTAHLAMPAPPVMLERGGGSRTPV